jgi:hypothetical protein
MNADLRIGQIKGIFNAAAGAATSKDAVNAAYETAANSALTALGQIETSMENDILKQAPGYDLSDAKSRLDTILTAARVEVELNQANQNAKFDVRNIKESFTADIMAAETEEGVVAVTESVRAQIDDFEATLNGELERVLDLGREAVQQVLATDSDDVARAKQALADRVGEAEAYADQIRDSLRASFEDSYGEAELQATSRATAIIFKGLQESYASQFEHETTKDGVDTL